MTSPGGRENSAAEPLKAGDPYRCPRCRRPHVVEQPYATSRTTAERLHLFITCGGGRYFVGQARD